MKVPQLDDLKPIERNRIAMRAIKQSFPTEVSDSCTSLMWETTIVQIAYLWLFMATHDTRAKAAHNALKRAQSLKERPPPPLQKSLPANALCALPIRKG